MAPNRVVALAAPLIAPLAGAFAAWLSQNTGIKVPEEAMEEVFLAVSALVFGLAFQFNHNRFKWDQMIELQAADPAADADPLIDGAAEPEAYEGDDEIAGYDEDDVDFDDDDEDEFVEPLADDDVDTPAPVPAAAQS